MKILSTTVLAVTLISVSLISTIPATASANSQWLAAEAPFAIQKILQNSSAKGAAPGIIVASPSTSAPNYYYYWVRDGALTMATIVSLWQTVSSPQDTSAYGEMLDRYVKLTQTNQAAHSLTGLGEPKFNIDGSPFMGPWGRPQNDGPALRAITLIRLANTLLARGSQSYVRTLLYDSKLPTNSVIKTDLEYVAHNWQQPSFDLWEEVRGTHFYTRMVQRKALLWGANLADKLGDPNAAAYYRQQANAIAASLTAFWDNNRHIIIPTLDKQSGIDKPAGLDIAIILGALHGGLGDGFFDVYDSRVAATLTALEHGFTTLYPINHQNLPATAIGRYIEDVYDGNTYRYGNPWVLTTLAGAEFHYLRKEVALGDAYAERVGMYMNKDRSLSEQFDRNTGAMTSARDLTWNYAAVLTTLQAAAYGRYVGE